jgi:hypothetical protein
MPIEEYQTGQWIRLVNVFILGPYLIWLGINDPKLNPYLRFASLYIGAFDIINNGRNYLKIMWESQKVPPGTPLELSTYANSQLLRLAVIFITSPVMILIALKAKKPPTWQRVILVLLGIYQIYMHSTNYFKYGAFE